MVQHLSDSFLIILYFVARNRPIFLSNCIALDLLSTFTDAFNIKKTS